MLESLQLWSYGAAAVVDAVLLFALLERHNWRTVTVWMLLLATGVFCWHGGAFVRHLLDHSVGPLADPARWLAMLTMAGGLLLMPSAALHGTARLLRHGEFRIADRADPRLALCYLPLGFLVPIGRSLAAEPAVPFVTLVADYRLPYLAWLCVVTAVTTSGLLYSATKSAMPVRRFYRALAASMTLIALLTAAFVSAAPRWPASVGWLQIAAGISPILPVLLFAYFVMRFQFLPIVLERTLVYGAVIVGAMLFHQIMLRDFTIFVEGQYRFDLAILEGIVVLSAILLYQPLRDRTAEAIEYFVNPSTARRAERTRLAVRLAARAGQPLPELLDWFTATVQSAFGSDRAAAWLCDRTGRVVERAGAAELLDDARVSQMLAALARTGEDVVTRYSSSQPEVLEFLDRSRAGALLRFDHPSLSGLFLIGCRRWAQPPTGEELHALALLVEQLGVTLHNTQLQAARAAAERRVLQQEKLSTLGLLAGSLAHEIKNPLSSIKTITRVLAEELGPASPHAEDLRMIGGEIDRLAASTSQLLEVARPPRADNSPIPLTDLLSPTLRLLQHLARERKATLETQFPAEPLLLSPDCVNLREIVFNLIANGLDAAAGGRVRLACRREDDRLLLEVHDTGPGIAAELQPKLFDPFFTTKETGTGLGLYVVARRVRELGGEIACHSAPGQGTTFILRLPIGPADADNGESRFQN